MAFREHVKLLVNEIHRDLPDYTVHDITHLDALWEIADIVCGNSFRLTPTESFVLGGAFLLHDAAMSLAAYPDGSKSLRRHDTWPDIVSLLMRSRLNRLPTKDEIGNPPDAVDAEAIAMLLRNLHASQAEHLAQRPLAYGDHGVAHYLIEDFEIRNAWGRIIGLIAHSHWWSVDQLDEHFSRTIGPPHWCPAEWTVDPLKIACILRTSDAAHIDSRRAPLLLMALRRPPAGSREHWMFQTHLHKPHLDGDALSFTSGHAFPLAEAAAWWLCVDTLTMIDRELRQVDALLADKGLQRLAARRVAGIDSPERVAAWIPTAGWMPVDASFHVNDVPALIRKLGGEELYGRTRGVALRELIQNGADAVRARILLEGRSSDWGFIEVRLGRDDRGEWLEVEDNGVGMSRNVLTRHLLEFGGSFWNSQAVVAEFPGLITRGMKAAGRYGIGFFSVFMLGDSIQIRTRRADAAQRDTLVLEINGGLSSRPILRYAEPKEHVRDGGTCVRVWLSQPSEKILLEGAESLAQLCGILCPAIDVEVRTDEHGNRDTAVRREEWMHCSGEEFVVRLRDIDGYWRSHENDPGDSRAFHSAVSANLELLMNEDGECVGRACVALDSFGASYLGQPGIGGVVTVGGFLASLTNGVAGILTGAPTRASRDRAFPLVSRMVLRDWSSRQALIVPRMYSDAEAQSECAAIVRKCGGDTGPLPVAWKNGRWLTADEISRLRDLPSEIVIAPPFGIRKWKERQSFRPRDEVFFVEPGWRGLIMDRGPYSGGEWWPDFNDPNEMDMYFPPELAGASARERYIFRTLTGLVIVSIAKACNLSLRAALKAIALSHDEMQERTIAYIENEGIVEKVYVIQNPPRPA